MARRHATSAPPSGSSQNSSSSHRSRRRRHHHHQSQRRHGADVESREKESGFDWAPGIAIALLGTLAYLNRDIDKHVRFDDDTNNDNNNEEEKRWRRKSSSRSGSSASDESISPPPPSQERKRRGRSKTPKEEGDREKEGIEKYYEYGPKPGKPAICEDCDDD